MPENGKEIIIRYLEEAVAAERNFEDLLTSFSNTEISPVREMFIRMAAKACSQHERLEARLRELGASAPAMKSAAPHIVGFTPSVAQAGHTEEEKDAQHLMMAYASAAAEMAMYESLAVVAAAGGDQSTERLARELQTEERDDHEMVWDRLRQTVLELYRAATG
jgi:ferritin-like metal-binding protein YciE